MFRFYLGDKFGEKHISWDSIAPEMRNRFNACSIDPCVDKRLQVRLDEKALRFFFYDGPDVSGVVAEEYYKEIFSISLTNKKETGYDILNLKKQIESKSAAVRFGQFVASGKTIPWNEICQRVGGEAELFNFPFVERWNWELGDENNKEWFCLFIRCCFLRFVVEFEKRESDFPNSPYYDHVRDRLRECVVYRLLCAKVKYTVYLYQGEDSCSQDEYTYKAQQFVDLLMDKSINKIIPPYSYDDDDWFYNPEAELDLIVDREADSARRGGVRFDEKLENKIRDYFFRHHSVISAMGNKRLGNWYKAYVFIIGVYSLMATYCMLYFDDCDNVLINWFFKNMWIWDAVALFSVAVLVLLAVKRSINVFMPRVLVALGIGWLTAFISEDLIKSQLEITSRFTLSACLMVLTLIVVMLFGEARQHSPYYLLNFKIRNITYFIKERMRFHSMRKLLPVLVHSYFWALTLGGVMQFALYDKLLENSKVLPEVVYDDVFEQADTYIMHLQGIKEAITAYEDDWNVLLLGKSRVTGFVKNKDGFGYTAETSTVDYGRFMGRCGQRIGVVKAKIEEFDKAYGNYDLVIDTFFVSKLELNSGFLKTADALDENQVSDSIKKQLNEIDEMLLEIDEEISLARLFIAENKGWKPLIDWSRCERSPIIVERDITQEEKIHSFGAKEVDFLRRLEKNARKNHNLFREVKMFWFGWPLSFKNLYPRMLVFHSLIVLLIAFVGQLIVSDKSVTEPL